MHESLNRRTRWRHAASSLLTLALLAACGTTPPEAPGLEAPNDANVDKTLVALAAPPPGQGLAGTYYSNPDLTGTTATRVDAPLSINWRYAEPFAGFGDTWSVRWEGFLEAPATGTYTLITTTDDGARLWVSGAQVINDWTRHAAKENRRAVTLQGGARIPVRLEFFDGGGRASVKFEWIRPDGVREVVPSAALFPPPAPPATPPSDVNAGQDVTIILPDARVALSGSASGASGVAWTQVSGPERAVFEQANVAQTRVALNTAGTYVLRFTARDAAGTARSDDVQVTVEPNPVVLGSASTVLDHLLASPRPVFKTGHTLLPLTRSDCGMNGALAVELARHWGYSLEMTIDGRGGAFDKSGGLFTQEIKANPGRYRVTAAAASMSRYFDNYAGTSAQFPALPASTWLRDASGAIILQGRRPIVSPAAPDEAFRIVGEHASTGLAQLAAGLGQPIEFVRHEGESGLWIVGDNNPQTHFGRDPAVLAHYKASGFGSWFDYLSFHKARQERLIRDHMLRNLVRRPVYSLYQEAYGGERGRWWGWRNWMFKWEQFVNPDGTTKVSDYSSPEFYHKLHNSGMTGVQSRQGLPYDMLTLAARNIGGTLWLRQKFVYPWLSMGTEGEFAVAEPDRYLGFLKSLYTLGAIGGVSGYFVCSGPLFETMRNNGVTGTTRPTQLAGAMLLGQAQALFSHLEADLRGSDLLPGPNTHPFRDAEVLPAYEFPVIGETVAVSGVFGTVNIPTARVVARKVQGVDRWLVTAWANTGEDRDVRVNVDSRLGTLTLRARKAGSVYIVTINGGQVNVRLVDVDAMNPTKTLFP